MMSHVEQSLNQLHVAHLCACLSRPAPDRSALLGQSRTQLTCSPAEQPASAGSAYQIRRSLQCGVLATAQLPHRNRRCDRSITCCRPTPRQPIHRWDGSWMPCASVSDGDSACPGTGRDIDKTRFYSIRFRQAAPRSARSPNASFAAAARFIAHALQFSMLTCDLGRWVALTLTIYRHRLACTACPATHGAATWPRGGGYLSIVSRLICFGQ